MGGRHIVELVKLTDYLLSGVHPTGKVKAAFFTAFGFDIGDPDTLAAALDDHARHRPIVRTIDGAFGKKREIRCNWRRRWS